MARYKSLSTMGLCLSTPAPGDGHTEVSVGREPIKNPGVRLRQASEVQPSPSNASAGSLDAIAYFKKHNTDPAAPTLDLLREVQELQEELAEVSSSPVLGLAQAAELLALHFEVDLVGVWCACNQAQGPPCLVLLAAHGDGADVLRSRPVVRGAAGAAAVAVSAEDGAQQLKDLPQHLRGLAAMHSMHSMHSMPIGPGPEPLGALLLASRSTQPFSNMRWLMRLQAASIGLMRLMRQQQVAQVCSIVAAMDGAEDELAAISTLLRSAPRFMQSACNVRAAARLALLRGSSSDTSAALLFEAPKCLRRQPAAPGPEASASAAGGPCKSVVAPSDASADVTASALALGNTLLGSAARHRQARFVRDCGQYMQTSPFPARDVFGQASDIVASVVVLPLFGRAPQAAKEAAAAAADASPEDAPVLGGLYFELDVPCDFENMRDTLLGFVSGVMPVLCGRLAGEERMAAVEAAVSRAAASRRNSRSSTSGSSDDDSRPLDAARGAASPPGAGGSSGPRRNSGSASTATPSGRVGCTGSRHVNVEAMLQMLQQEVRQGWRRSLKYLPELVVSERIGREGFGAVYRGYWHKAAAAIKVMYLRSDDREAMRDAVEMAVLSSVQHPNIVQVYSCLTNMAEVSICGVGAGASGVSGGGAGGGTTSGSGGGALARPSCIRYRKLLPEECLLDDIDACNVLVMEYCDRGALRDAVLHGALHVRLPCGAVGVDLAAALEVLLQVACAVQHLHGMQLVHGDLKPENILLKSDASCRLGATVKLINFGMSKILNEADHAVNLRVSGTVTHLAPEMFTAGSKVTKAVDSYAFGILMWELYTGARPYSGLAPGAIAQRVFSEGLRPAFPPDAPEAYVRLARDCWAADPALRPAFGAVAERLERLMGSTGA